MKIKLILIGKTVDKNLIKLIDEYQNRLKHYIPFEEIVIPELKNTKKMTIEQQKEKETELIFTKISSADDLILLDENGETFTSVKFSKFLEKKILSSSKSIVFVVGGAYGFSNKLYERANMLISLSAMTFSHQMIRLLFAEQLYRAFTIMKGEPYHHE